MLIARCRVCGKLTDGGFVCEDCLSRIRNDYLDCYMERCPSCSRPLLDSLYLCPHCTTGMDFRLFSVTEWNCGFSKDILASYKFGKKRNLDKVVSLVFKENLQKHFSPESIVVPVPCSEKGLEDRGFDHMKLVASLTGLRYEFILENCNNDKVEQKKLSRNMRISHSIGRFRVVDNDIPLTSPIVVIDDIVTTSSTITSAVRALKDAGFTNISAMSWFTVLQN